MDHLTYRLVEEITSYLPRTDVETIARVAARSPRLQNWSIASEDQLDRRVALKVCVHLQGFKREENETERNPRILLSVQKLLSDGSREEWDFTGWRYAWIQFINIKASVIDDLSTMEASAETFKESDIDQVLRLVSLSVDLSTFKVLSEENSRFWKENAARSCLHIENACYGGGTPRNLVDLFWKTIGKTRKEFVSVAIDTKFLDVLGPFDLFVTQFIERGAFLEYLSYYDQSALMSRICEATAPWFGKTRGRPLNVSLPCNDLKADEIGLIIDAWLQSDGTFEEKGVEWGIIHDFSVWFTVKAKYEALRRVPYGRYLAHPTKSSSLFIKHNVIHVVKFEPWHVPVDFERIDSLIGKWREGCGFYAWRGKRTFYFSFKDADDWEKLVEKYGPTVDGENRLPIAHLTGTTFLEVIKSVDWIEIRVKHEFYTMRRLESLISRWKEGNGETLDNGLTKMEVVMAKDLGRDPYSIYVSPLSLTSKITSQHSHPLGSTRCLIVQKYSDYDRSLERISIVPIDPEEVEDWNLELLFGSLQV
uniref:F-box domain-containing protein n=1 Tax=Steinernema glaseri TaxID=37863 RepID=A0A1I8AS06_9BILA